MSGLPRAASSFGLWKIGAILAIIVAVVVGGFAIKTQIESNQIGKENAKLQESITNPTTGYIARLNTARNNVIILEAAVRRQNAEYIRQSQAAQAEMTRLKQTLAAAQRRSAQAQREVNALMGQTIEGKTAQERMDSVDKMILEDLQK